MSTWTLQISKEGNSRWKKQQVQRPWGPVNKSMSLGHAATEGPEDLGEDIHVIVSKMGSHCRDDKIPFMS